MRPTLQTHTIANMITVAFVCLLLVVLLRVPGATSIPGISGPSNLISSTKDCRSSMTDACRYLQIDGNSIDLRFDWMVNLSDNEKGSIDITHKSFLLELRNNPRKGTSFTVIYESGTANADKTVYTVALPIMKSQKKLIVTPSLYFPRNTLSQAHRLAFKVPRCSFYYTHVTIIDTPSNVDVMQQKFNFNYWRLNQAMHNQTHAEKRFTLSLDATFYYEYARMKIEKANPSELRNPLRVSGNGTIFGVQSKLYTFKSCHDRADPRAKLITAISRKLAHFSSGLLAGSSGDNRLLQVVPHSLTPTGYSTALRYFTFVGRFVGIAIANRLPVDISFSTEIIQALLNQDKLKPRMTVGKGYLLGTNAQVNAQIQALCQGVWDVVPRSYLTAFNEEQLGWIISGRPEITVQMLKELVTYEGGLPVEEMAEEYFLLDMSEDDKKEIIMLDNAGFKRDQVMQWFWDYVAKLPKNSLRTLVEMITNSATLPPLYYTDQWSFSCEIESNKWNKPGDECMPMGDISSNNVVRLFVPPYSSQKILEHQFNRAMRLWAT